MARPVKWSRDLHLMRERAQRSRAEIWSRHDIEKLFEISRPSAQNLMKAIGGVQMIGAAHFIDRTSLLRFLDEMVAAESVDDALRARYEQAEPVPRASALRLSLPEDLRRVTLKDLPVNVLISAGEIRVTGTGAEQVLEGLVALAQVMQNDLDSVRARLDPPANPESRDEELHELFATLRRRDLLEKF